MHLKANIALGIDVCKRFLDVVHSTNAQACRFDNSPAGLSALMRWLSTQPAVQVMVLESTGGHEALAFRTLSAAGSNVAVVNPKRVRDFARAAGILAKTDRLDAAVLAQYAIAMGVNVSVPKNTAVVELQAWLHRRTQLVAMQTAERNRRALASPSVRKHIDRFLKLLRADHQNHRSEAQGGAQSSTRLERPACTARWPQGPGSTDSCLAHCQLARAGRLGSTPHRRLGRGRAICLRFRLLSRSAPYPRRTRAPPHYALLGRLERHQTRSDAEGLLSIAARSRQSQKGGARRLHAQTANHHQCHFSPEHALQRTTGGARGMNTVAARTR